ncbi:hypothetical protein PMAYCL1PPCAC_00523, partial [Pristionchus mayeri]
DTECESSGETEKQIAPAAAASGKIVTPHQTAHDANILHMMVADSPKAMFLDGALSQLHTEFDKCDKDELKQFFDGKKRKYFECESCEVSILRGSVLDHFFSEE